MTEMTYPGTRWSAMFALAALVVAAPLASAQVGRATTNRATPATPNANTPAMSGMAMPHGIVPNTAELPDSAFAKLDANNKGYVTLDDVAQLPGFESAFRQADQNHDGRLNPSEFDSAWAIYTGNNP